jgi:hypothetical protein
VAGTEAATKNHVILGTTLLETAITIFAPALMMPLCSASRPDHETVHVVEEHKGDEILVAVENEAGSFVGAFCIDDTAKLKSLSLFRAHAFSG